MHFVPFIVLGLLFFVTLFKYKKEVRLPPNNKLPEETGKCSKTCNGAGSTELNSNLIRKGLNENICTCMHLHFLPPFCAKQSSEMYRHQADLTQQLRA